MHHSTSSRFPLLLPLAIAAAAVLFLSGCATNPATGKRQLILMSEGQEAALGRENDPQIGGEYGWYSDERLGAYVDGVGRKIAVLSHRPALEWHFKVVDSPVVNAFALPGGYIYVTRGILAHLNSEAELAAVVGHEIGHVTARHTAARYTKATLVGLSLGVGGIAVPRFNQFSRVAETGLGVLFLKFSRDDERQADDLGVGYAAKAGYDPQAAIEVFRMLEMVTDTSERSPLPTWLSTHPAPENRQVRLREMVTTFPEARTVNREAFLRSIDGVTFGEDPREGFVEGDLFLHPTMRFAVRFPHGWKIQNTKQYVLAVEPSESAALKLSVEGNKLAAEPAATRAAEREKADVGEIRRERINGMPAVIAWFQPQGTPEDPGTPSLNAFIEFDETVYRIQGIARKGEEKTRQSALYESMRSFRELRSGEAAGRRPDVIAVRAVAKRMSLREAVAAYSTGSATPATVAILNQQPLETVLNPGTAVKVVVQGK